MSTRKAFRSAVVSLCCGCLVLSVTPARADVDEDAVIPLLKTKTGTYTNVTVTSRTAKEVCILHAGGVGNIYLEDLEPEAYPLVGYVPPVSTGEALRAKANEQVGEVLKLLPVAETSGGTPTRQPDLEALWQQNASALWLMLAFMVVGYLFQCYCLMLICTKAGHPPGLLIWLPVLQVFPLLRAAGMSAWWVLGMLVPLLNLVVGILWCFNIVSARGKSAVWAILLLLPFTNLIAFLYLAFSGDGNHEEERPPRLPTLAVRPV